MCTAYSTVLGLACYTLLAVGSPSLSHTKAATEALQRIASCLLFSGARALCHTPLRVCLVASDVVLLQRGQQASFAHEFSCWAYVKHSQHSVLQL